MTPGRTSSPLRPVRPTWALSLLLLALLPAADAACTDGAWICVEMGPSGRPPARATIAAAAIRRSPAAACPAGYLKLDLVSVSGGGSCDSSLLATCLPSLRVGISAACVVSLTPLLVTGTTLVPAIWSTNPGGTYAQLSSCPTAATTAVDPGSSPSQAQLKAAIEAAFEQHIYGADYQQALTSVTWTSGTVSLLTTSGSCTLKYAVTEVSPSDSAYTSQIGADAAPAVCDISGSLVDGGECMMNLADSCAAGRRPVELPSGGKACALCRAGAWPGGGLWVLRNRHQTGRLSAPQRTTRPPPCMHSTTHVSSLPAASPQVRLQPRAPAARRAPPASMWRRLEPPPAPPRAMPALTRAAATRPACPAALARTKTRQPRRAATLGERRRPLH